MARLGFSNNATTTLANAITSGATSLSVVAGGGAQFPTPPFRATLVSQGNATVFEIVLVTASPLADNFTVTRAQEGTTALAWNAGDYFNQLWTAGDASTMVQPPDLQVQATNFGYDTGVANAYSVTYNPAITAHVVGAPLRWIAGHTNTGPSTFNDGAGAANLILPGGGSLVAGQIAAGGMYTAVFDGTNFQIPEIPTNLNALYQQVVNAVYPVGAYALWENDGTTPGGTFTWQTWTEVQGVVLVGRQPSTTQFASTGQQGGEISHTLVVTEIPPLPYKDHYYPEDWNLVQPGDQADNIGSINHGIGSASTDYNNTYAWYLNGATQSGSNGAAAPHNNLQPYRVVRMWRRTA